jgi:hypothetical protein
VQLAARCHCWTSNQERGAIALAAKGLVARCQDSPQAIFGQGVFLVGQGASLHAGTPGLGQQVQNLGSCHGKHWPDTATSAEVPFMMMLLRGKAYLRMEYKPADLRRCGTRR